MPDSDSYGAFAYAYDKALGERFFKAIRGLLKDSLERWGTGGRRRKMHLDVACGTGLVLEYFRRQGWSSIGIDASIPMLEVARVRVPDVPLAVSDFRALPFGRQFALVTCLYDSLNHLMTKEELEEAFCSIRATMDDEALFLFDMNHPEIYPEVWGMAEPFYSSGANWELEIATTYRSRDRVGKASVKGWAIVGEQRIEIDEQHRQRAYTEKEIRRALERAEIAVHDVVDFDPFAEEGRAAKLYFVCGPK
jgi:SAM-dependent methyltransferase